MTRPPARIHRADDLVASTTTPPATPIIVSRSDPSPISHQHSGSHAENHPGKGVGVNLRVVRPDSVTEGRGGWACWWCSIEPGAQLFPRIVYRKSLPETFHRKKLPSPSRNSTFTSHDSPMKPPTRSIQTAHRHRNRSLWTVNILIDENPSGSVEQLLLPGRTDRVGNWPNPVIVNTQKRMNGFK